MLSIFSVENIIAIKKERVFGQFNTVEYFVFNVCLSTAKNTLHQIAHAKRAVYPTDKCLTSLIDGINRHPVSIQRQVRQESTLNVDASFLNKRDNS